MDTWLIAQCMAKLPPLTYFSHPESSLDDFFVGEATIVNVNPRSNYSSIRKGPAQHELRFLMSLGQSLGIHPLVDMANNRAIELGSNRPSDRLFRCYFSDLARGYPSTPAKRDVVIRLSDATSHYRTAEQSVEINKSTRGPTSGSILPFVGGPTNIQTYATSSATVHVVTYANFNRPHTAQLRSDTRSSSGYQCDWEVAKGQHCGERIQGGSKEVWIHVRTTHGLKGRYGGQCQCRWVGCLEKLKVSSLHRHLAKHLDIRWSCSSCNMIFARCDYARRHIRLKKACRGAGCYVVGPGGKVPQLDCQPML